MQSEKVPYYILDLLQQVPSVYVPGLGRFDAIFHPAVIDFPQSKIKPPYIEPGFAEKNSGNGELLPAYMQYVSGIPFADAILQITEFVRNVNEHLQSGDSFSIDKFGTFSKSPAEIIHFTPDWDAFNLSFKGLEEIDLHIPVYTKETESPVYHTPPVVIPTPEVSIPIEVSETPSQYVPVVTPETNWVTDKESDTPPITEEKVVVVNSPVISDSTSRLWWIILATALFLITILCAYLAWDILSNRKRLNAIAQSYPVIKPIENANETPAIIDTSIGSAITEPEVVQEETPPEEQVQPETPAIENNPPDIKPPVTEINNDGNACYIIVGAFSDPANVTRMVDRLQSMGYESAQLKGSTLTKVGIKTSCDPANVQQVLQEARASISPEAWIH